MRYCGSIGGGALRDIFIDSNVTPQIIPVLTMTGIMRNDSVIWGRANPIMTRYNVKSSRMFAINRLF